MSEPVIQYGWEKRGVELLKQSMDKIIVYDIEEAILQSKMNQGVKDLKKA